MAGNMGLMFDSKVNIAHHCCSCFYVPHTVIPLSSNTFTYLTFGYNQQQKIKPQSNHLAIIVFPIRSGSICFSLSEQWSITSHRHVGCNSHAPSCMVKLLRKQVQSAPACLPLVCLYCTCLGFCSGFAVEYYNIIGCTAYYFTYIITKYRFIGIFLF